MSRHGLARAKAGPRFLAPAPRPRAFAGRATGQRPAAAATEAPAGPEVLSEVRIHGNYATPDAEVLRLAGITIGQPLGSQVLEDIRARLVRSGRFDAVEIRKRFRSLTDTSQVALVIIVREHPVPEGFPPGPLGPARRILASGMFLPILDYTDGYGLTYGGRVSFVDALGRGGRLSVPLTWGASKRAAVEVGRPVTIGPASRLFIGGAASVSRVENPFYRVNDDRREVRATLERELSDGLRLGGHAGLAHVSFDQTAERLACYGVDLSFDTRLDPVFPRNAVFAGAGWERLDPRNGPGVDRVRADVRGYVGLLGQTVIALRAQYWRANRPLPPYERLLLGGAGTLRGYRAGSFSGDNLAAAAVELRIPFNSPLRTARTGFTLFADAGAAYDHGTRLADARFHRGAGGGVFLAVSVLQLSAEVGIRQGWGTRLHLTSGVRF